MVHMALTTTKTLEIVLDKAKKELVTLRSPAIEEAEGLVLRTEADFLTADGLRSRIKKAIKIVEEKLDPIIADIRPGLDKLYALKRSEITPLEEADGIITTKMKDFRRAEQKRIDEAARAQRLEAERIDREAEETRRRAAAAATPQVAKRLERKADALDTKAVDVATTPLKRAVEADHSSTRTVKVWKVADIGTILQGILDGEIPADVIMVDSVTVNKAFRTQPDVVAAWPGFTVYDDVQIVGRR